MLLWAMTILDEGVDADGERTTLRRLASEHRLVLRRSRSFSALGPSEPRALVLWADLTDPSSSPGTHGWEISEASYTELLAMGVPEIQPR